MYECPVGYVLRESPHTYTTIDACALYENATPSEFLAMPRYFQHACRAYMSETARLEALRIHAQKSRRDADYMRRKLQQR